ncbi:MAG: DNA (cytosine-5)-methyltransferase 1 [Phenylobacterium sp.]|jgi:DNA (cytosine-5)-methyltransferase 1
MTESLAYQHHYPQEEGNYFPAIHLVERPAVKPRCVDFFAGSGLVAQAMKSCFDTVWANDICQKKQAVFAANHPPDIFYSGSIEHINGRDLPAHEVSWASFPCQDLSVAGNITGIKGQRSGLVWQWLRVIDEMAQHPPVVVAENVVGLVSAKSGEHYLSLHNALRERGYSVGAVMLDAVNWLPHSRPRIFVIGIKQNLDYSSYTTQKPNWAHSKAIISIAAKAKEWVWWQLPTPAPRTTDLSSMIDFALPFDDAQKVSHHLNMIPDNHKLKLAAAAAVKKGVKVFPGYKRTRHGKQVLEIRFDGIAGCLRTPSGGSSRQQLVIYKDGILGTRLISIREAARLMGAEDSYQIPGSYNQGYKAMGDAIAVPAVNYLSEHLLSKLAALATEQAA